MGEPQQARICKLCNGTVPVGEGILTQSKGTQRFIEVSLAKNDGLAAGLAPESRILCHDKCWRAYTTYTIKPPKDTAAIKALAKWATRFPHQVSMTEILQEAKRFKELTAVEPKIIEEKVQELMVKEYLISKRPGKSTIYTKKSSVEQILGDHFDMSNRSQADKTKEVAGLLRDEILRLPTNTTHFPSYSELDDPASKVPPLVREFLETVGGKRLGSALPLITACQILQKVVVARGYVSPIQLYLGAVIYQQFKSKRIINFCNKFGLTSAYTEILNLFKTNASQMPRILEGGYVQYGWDNLDISSFSFEGEVQLHHLIGLQIVSPRTAIDLQQPIPREPVKKVAEEFYNIQVLECPEEATTPMISLYEDVMPVKKDNRHDDFESECDSWLEQTTESHIGWKGWLEKEHGAQETANNAGFLITPRIQQPANNYSSLFTAMKATIGMCPVKNQNRVIFTVDNALYLKTLKIHINLRNTDVEIARIVPSLGPWHLWLNFLGAVGNIMRGSGIEDLIKVLYSNRTCGIILAGQDYQRGLRAHLLIHEGLLVCHAVETYRPPASRGRPTSVRVLAKITSSQLAIPRQLSELQPAERVVLYFGPYTLKNWEDKLINCCGKPTLLIRLSTNKVVSSTHHGQGSHSGPRQINLGERIPAKYNVMMPPRSLYHH
ncbi:uncharacterized protein LOC132198908 isoform X4 [Neocloeon triangulifer]|uniref:uncharacterized protein LOC132198908 isoform X4 n=1 Tax=Neocloeon triangulifer TaxID=2078957 RepID=UPI00286EFDDF|nr:uncharacterized protein LOC132198908 isoform X4 [Neocloeon triangulifer]